MERQHHQVAITATTHRTKRKANVGSQPSRDTKLQSCIEVIIELDGTKARALLDSGSTIDMVSPDFVRVAKLIPIELEEQMALQLAVTGSRSRINYGTWADVTLGPIKERRYFDIANVDDYDVILGTPFLWSNGLSPIFEDGGRVMHKGQQLKLADEPSVVKTKRHRPLPKRQVEEKTFRSTQAEASQRF